MVTPPNRSGSRRPLARRVAGAVAGVALTASLVACGEDRDPLEQPHLGGERFTKITFEELPRPANGTQVAYLATGLIVLGMFGSHFASAVLRSLSQVVAALTSTKA